MCSLAICGYIHPLGQISKLHYSNPPHPYQLSPDIPQHVPSEATSVLTVALASLEAAQVPSLG